MKKEIKLVLVLATTICSFSACNNASTTNETKDTTVTTAIADSNKTEIKMDEGMMQPMSSMTEKMSNTKLTGDFDNDFAALMIEHHQGAVDISEMELSKGSDEQMKKMAQTMVADHKSEIEQLKAFISHHNSSPEHKNGKVEGHTHEDGNENDLSNIMKMESTNNMKMTGYTDKDYAMMMKAHHENAIKMSKAEVAHGHHAELKKMAQKMIDDDSKEVTIFEKYLSSMK